jgi:uncharacterized protein
VTGLVEEARSYFELAHSLLDSKPSRLVAIAGLSGSGKTSVAEMLAARIGAPPGARIVESDIDPQGAERGFVRNASS